VLRTVSDIAGGAFTYTAAMMTADFGSAVFNFVGRIYQKSDVVGRGAAWEGYVFPSTFIT
jgi:hypothetical protein